MGIAAKTKVKDILGLKLNISETTLPNKVKNIISEIFQSSKHLLSEKTNNICFTEDIVSKLNNIGDQFRGDNQSNEVHKFNKYQPNNPRNLKQKIFNGDEIFIEDLELSIRSYNTLKRAGINKFDDVKCLKTKDDILNTIKHIGNKSCEELLNKITEVNKIINTVAKK